MQIIRFPPRVKPSLGGALKGTVLFQLQTPNRIKYQRLGGRYATR